MNKKLLIIVAAVLVVVGAVAYFMFFSGGDKTADDEASAAPVSEVVSEYVPGDYFVTNVKDSSHHLKVSMVLAIEGELTDKLMDGKVNTTKGDFAKKYTYLIRNTVVSVLREKSFDELMKDTALDDLSAELADKIRKDDNMPFVKAVFFTDYVVQ